ncbi:MAG: methyltransferase domain-containing protein [Pyrobaculum sp.]
MEGPYWWAKAAREAYLKIGEEYGATRTRPLYVADFGRLGDRALDVGSGRGAQSLYIEHEHRYVVRCDLDRRIAAGGEAVECEATLLPFRDKAFDVVYLVAVVHHMPREAAAAALREAKRVGRLAVATAWAPEAWRGRRLGGGAWEVPWGGRAVRIYFEYGVADLLEMAPARPLSLGFLKRGRHFNIYILF